VSILGRLFGPIDYENLHWSSVRLQPEPELLPQRGEKAWAVGSLWSFGWDAIALHATRSIALHKEPEVAMTHSGIAVDVIGAGLDRIPQDKVRAILAEFPRLLMKKQFQERLCGVVRQKPATSYDNLLRDIGMRYVAGYTAPTFADFLENAPFAE
jgi:hypothetical protein